MSGDQGTESKVQNHQNTILKAFRMILNGKQLALF